MVSEKTRNTIVGLTVIVALVCLMYGVLLLGKGSSFSVGGTYNVTVVAQDAGGLGAGTKVFLNGVVVGQVQSVTLMTDAAKQLQAKIVLQIDGGFDIPAGAWASVTRSQLGSTSISLFSAAATGPMLPRNGKAVLVASQGDTGLIPKDVRDNLSSLSTQLGTVAQDLHVLLAYTTPEEVEASSTQPTTGPGAATQKRPVDNVSTLVIRLNRTIKSMETLLTDAQLQGDVRLLIQNLREASVKLNGTMTSIDSTIKDADRAFSSFGEIATKASKTIDATQVQVLRVSEKLVDVLGQFEKTIKQVSEGNGTVGKLMNDPRLFEGLLDLSKTMKTTVNDLDFLLKKWKDEGVNFHIK